MGAGSLTISATIPTATNFSLNGSSSSVSLVAGSNISLATGASSITINVTGPKISFTQNSPLQQVGLPVASQNGLGSAILLGSSLFLDRVFIPGVINLSEIDMAGSFNFNNLGTTASGSVNRSIAVYSFVNSTSLASILSTTLGISFSGTSTTVGTNTAFSQVAGGWTQPGGVIIPMTFASSSLAPGDYVFGNILAFSAQAAGQASLFGVAANITTAGQTVGAVTGITSATLGGLSSGGLSSGSLFTSSSSNAAFATGAGKAFAFLSLSGATSTSYTSSTQTLAAVSESGTQIYAFSGTPAVVSLMSSGGLLAGSFVTASGSIGAVTNVGLAALGSTTINGITTGFPGFNYLGNSSVLTGGLFYAPFQNGVMSTGGIPANITLTTGTTAGLTTYGSTAAAQPWFCVVGQ
jgi:hypothetical protein